MTAVPTDGPAAGDAGPDDVVDAVYAISCRSLPVDHAHALSRAVQGALPWFADEPGAALHTIHGAASGSGWMRPEGAHERVQLSRRARLVLRLPRQRLRDAAALLGRTLDIAGESLRVDRLWARPLSRNPTLFSRGVVLADGTAENAFLAAAERELAALGIRPVTMLCGRAATLATPERVYETCSLMVAGLAPEHSVALQRCGLGAERKLGCGVFIPCKSIADLRAQTE